MEVACSPLPFSDGSSDRARARGMHFFTGSFWFSLRSSLPPQLPPSFAAVWPANGARSGPSTLRIFFSIHQVAPRSALLLGRLNERTPLPVRFNCFSSSSEQPKALQLMTTAPCTQVRLPPKEMVGGEENLFADVAANASLPRPRRPCRAGPMWL